MINISEAIRSSEAYANAFAINAKRADEIVATYVSCWDNGDSFTASGMDYFNASRDGDSDEEAEACVAHAVKELNWLVARERISSLSEQGARSMADSIRALGATLNMSGVTVYPDDVMSIWAEENK